MATVTALRATGMEVGGVDMVIECQVSVAVFDPSTGLRRNCLYLKRTSTLKTRAFQPEVRRRSKILDVAKKSR